MTPMTPPMIVRAAPLLSPNRKSKPKLSIFASKSDKEAEGQKKKKRGFGALRGLRTLSIGSGKDVSGKQPDGACTPGFRPTHKQGVSLLLRATTNKITTRLCDETGPSC